MKIKNVWFDKKNMYVVLESGHTIGNPLNRFTRLNNATIAQRESYEIDEMGESIHWQEIDEYLSLESLFDFKHELNYAKI